MRGGGGACIRRGNTSGKKKVGLSAGEPLRGGRLIGGEIRKDDSDH